ncbi:putative FAD binding domain-containing protein [Rosellinia necatrix]|uniref:Putative FAD binding domain-containing protein n=1 Tax=Rosellinia necatrix TaxID=77044 RepID=A0A1W2TTT8_ROSNE|nr:putative FAD binding domain-containing protein [Rosellinia necatrix]
MYRHKRNQLYVRAAFMAMLSLGATSPSHNCHKPSCRYLPGDADWPSEKKWNRLNHTTGGKLIRGAPLAEPCYSPESAFGSDMCDSIRDGWALPETYYDDPVGVMSPYWLNDSCSPFAASSVGCSLGNLAAYALEIDSATTAAAGLKFAQQNNIRLSIKNTGHDYVGRSSGQGSLALWTHNLKDVAFVNYTSPYYTGPAIRAGAGVQFSEVYATAASHGLRVVGGYCPSVGMAGGYVQSGGYGPLAASYGLAADNALEFEVVTVDGRHLVASPTENSDLYWALSGSGAGNYAVVLSLTTKAHTDGPTAGASLAFANTDPVAYWAAVGAFQSHLLVLDDIPGFATSWGLDNQFFSLDVATLPGGLPSDIEAALDPFVQKLKDLGLPLIKYNTTIYPSFYTHFQHYTFPPEIYATNNTLGGRLIQHSTVKNSLSELLDAFREIAENADYPVKRISGNTINVARKHILQAPGRNSVLPAWREALYSLNVGISYSSDAAPEELRVIQRQVNEWQQLFSPITPGGGAYVNEATFDNPDWKIDYFGENYDKLLKIKKKYDPEFALWQHTSVGADAYWEVARDGRLCRVRN